MERQPNVEILVHIGAPSKAIDDARYRLLAAAYLDCEPTNIIRVHSQIGHGGSQEGNGPPGSWDADDGESSFVQSDHRMGSFRSPLASFRSVVDNANSPRIRRHEIPGNAVREHTPTSGIQASWETPPSVVQDSDPLDYTDFASLTSPTRVLENHLQNFESQTESYRKHPLSSAAVTPATHPYHENHESFSRKLVPCTPQMIPCTPQVRHVVETSPKCPNRITTAPNHAARLAGHDFPDALERHVPTISSAQPAMLLRAGSEPLLRPHNTEPSIIPHVLARTTSDVGPRPLSSGRAPVTIKLLSSHGFTYESLEIYPPDPPVSEPYIEPRDLITPGLQKLGQDMGLPSHFRPKEQTRDLRPYERGHWLLDCSSWEPELKRDAWVFLANYIGTGTAGWGIWCKRNPGFNELRAYCWGEIVPHVYYLLWLSSQKRIARTGCSWVDAEGVEVIRTGPKNDL